MWARLRNMLRRERRLAGHGRSSASAIPRIARSADPRDLVAAQERQSGRDRRGPRTMTLYQRMNEGVLSRGSFGIGLLRRQWLAHSDPPVQAWRASTASCQRQCERVARTYPRCSSWTSNAARASRWSTRATTSGACSRSPRPIKVVTSGRFSLRVKAAISPRRYSVGFRRRPSRPARRPLRCARGFVGAFGERACIGVPRRQRNDRLDLGRDHVAKKFEIDRQRHFPSAAQHPCDLCRCGDGIGQHRLIAGDFLEHGKLRIDGARLVMQQEATGTLAPGAPAITTTGERSA